MAVNSWEIKMTREEKYEEGSLRHPPAGSGNCQAIALSVHTVSAQYLVIYFSF